MNCPNCNTELPNETKFCVNCGMAFSKPDSAYAPDAVNNQQSVQFSYQQPVADFHMNMNPYPQVTPNQQPGNSKPEKTKKKGKGLLIGILSAVLVAALFVGGFLTYKYFTNPSYKIDKALNGEEVDVDVILENFMELDEDDEIRADVINYFLGEAKENKDFSNISSIYEFMTEEEKDSVNDELVSFVESAYDDYKSEDIDYDEWCDICDSINDIVEDNEDIETLSSKASALKTSRDAYELGMKYFNDEEYEKAIEEFENVISNDANYDDAQKKIELAKEALLPSITGTWYTEVDLGPFIARKTGMEGIECTVELDLTFNEDNTCSLSFNDDSVSDAYETFIESMEEAYKNDVKKELEDKGLSLSDEQLDEALEIEVQDEGYDSFEEFVRYKYPYSTFKKIFAADSDTYSYGLSQEYLTIDNKDYEYELNGDILKIYKFAEGSNAAANLGITAITDFKKR